jgi:hypothetical protein
MGWKRSQAQANFASGVVRASNSSHSARNSAAWSGGSRPKMRVGGLRLALVLVGHVFRVVGEGVAGVDFHEVVDEHHLEDAQHVERLVVGMLGEHDDHEREMPGVLGAVLGAAALGDDGLAEDLLQLVHLDDEGDLAAEAFGGVVHGWSKGVSSRTQRA